MVVLPQQQMPPQGNMGLPPPHSWAEDVVLPERHMLPQGRSVPPPQALAEDLFQREDPAPVRKPHSARTVRQQSADALSESDDPLEPARSSSLPTVSSRGEERLPSRSDSRSFLTATFPGRDELRWRATNAEFRRVQSGTDSLGSVVAAVTTPHEDGSESFDSEASGAQEDEEEAVVNRAAPDNGVIYSEVSMSPVFEGLSVCCPGIRNTCPLVDEWLKSRIGLKQSIVLLVLFVVSCVGKFVIGEWAFNPSVNYFAFHVVANSVSLVVAMVVSFAMDGFRAAFQKIFCWPPLWRFAGVAFLFTLADASVVVSRWAGTSQVQIVTVGYLYLPIVVVLSYYVFNRNYGKLEWLCLGMMSMSVLTFVLLREQYRIMDQAPLQSLDSLQKSFTIWGFVLAMFAVISSAVGSVSAERIYKNRSRGLNWWKGRFYIMKVHMDATMLSISAALWLLSHWLIGDHDSFSDILHHWSQRSDADWFGDWSSWQTCMVFMSVIQGWTAGLVTKEFSTSFKSIVQTLCYVISMLIEDPSMGFRFSFKVRELPSILLTIILVLSALIFQIGRFNVKEIQRAAELVGERAAASSDHLRQKVKKRTSAFSIAWKEVLSKNAMILLYIVFDAVRNLTLAKALSSTSINPNSMTLVVYLIGIAIATCLTAQIEGCRELGRAWNPRKVLRCLPAGFLFALTTTLMNMAYSQGMNAALALILGKFYTPVAAIGARWILDKYYMWLEYVAISILTLASVTFGYLQAFSPGASPKWTSNNSRVAMLLVLGSAVTAAFNSLITERILKGEKVSFHIQKVRLDAACIFSTGLLIPLIGVISQRAQDVPWAMRPISKTCPSDSPCWAPNGCADPACDCACGTGLFFGWTRDAVGVIILALVVNTAYGWLVGKLVQTFSTVDRAIADSFSLLLVYFVGDPILNHSSLGNMCLNLVAMIVPLSTSIFAVAASEMKRAMEASDQLGRLAGKHCRGAGGEGTAVECSTTSDEDSQDSECTSGSADR